MSKRQQFKKLIQEVDYQKEYSYDQRAEIFNAFGVATSTKYINPVMMLTEIFKGDTIRLIGTSHTGAVQTAFNKDYSEDKSKNKSKYIELHTTNDKFDYYKSYHYIYNHEGKWRNDVSFRIEDDEVKVRLSNIDSIWLKTTECLFAKANLLMNLLGFEQIF